MLLSHVNHGHALCVVVSELKKLDPQNAKEVFRGTVGLDLSIRRFHSLCRILSVLIVLGFFLKHANDNFSESHIFCKDVNVYILNFHA